MADTNTTQTPAAQTTQAAKVKTVLEDMQTPRFFATVEDASNYLGACQTDFPDFESHPFVLNGVDAESGEFDPELYGEGVRVLVHALKTRTTKKKDAAGNDVETPGAVQAIVVTPVPAIDAIANDSQGASWLEKILNTAIVKAAMDPLRGASDYGIAAKDMPLTLEDFVTESRTASSVSQTFEALYKGIMGAFAAKSPAWARVMKLKAEFRKALESKAYALAVYPQLEDRGDKPSYFVMALDFGIATAKGKGLDPTIFETWKSTRDEKALAEQVADTTEEDFDLDDLEFATPKPKAEGEADAAAPATQADDNDGPGEQNNAGE